jgi:hypothetical protein
MLAPGTRIRQYEIIRELGRGGMGVVCLARDTRLGRRVAMKFLASAASRVGRERFLSEARATARCSHENIVVIHDADIHDGLPYMVLEYLEGATLARTIAGRRIGAGQAVELIVPVVRALVRAHEFGIVHRDLKPENVFVTHSGTVKVLDFGVAKLFAGTLDEGVIAGAPPLDSLPAGTPAYMAPEQLVMDVDARTDLWAVGMMLCEMLSGRQPFATHDADAIYDELMALDRPLPVGDVPDGLRTLVARCLAKRKAERTPSARALLAELEPHLPRRGGRALAEDNSPYPGLGAFQEHDAERFFGRAGDITGMLALLSQTPLAGVVGPSGVGKSSFVRAGVLPALKGGDEVWESLIVRPGRRPLAGLAAALARLDSRVFSSAALAATAPDPRRQAPAAGTADGAAAPRPEWLAGRLREEPGFLGTFLRERAAERRCHIVLFVDQLEELHTLGVDAGERRAYLACLAAVADDVSSPLRLIVSLRSDFLDRVAEDHQFIHELTRGLVFLRPLGREALREALVAPLEAVGYHFESEEIVERMVADLHGAAGALPLLQFAAAKLWDERDRARKVLTRAAYEAIGGVSGALAAHADAVLLALAPSTQRLARAVIGRLVTPERTRAVVDVGELREVATRPEEVDALIEQLAAARLVVVQTRGDGEGPTVELVHDSLVEGWPALRRWLDETKEEAAFLAELRAAARQWEARGRQPGLLWRGEAATEARLWRARLRGDLARREVEFLEAVFALASRATRIRNAVITAVIGSLLAVVAGGAVALVSIRRAQTSALEEADRAQREATRAQTEAERARSAEQQIKEQLAVIQNEQAARAAANAQVAQGEVALRGVNAELAQALGRAKDESARAREAARKAEELAASLARANSELQRLLAQERARAEQAEQQRKRLMQTLPK